SFLRQAPEVRAVCGSSARTDLCGGLGETPVPTATDTPSRSAMVDHAEEKAKFTIIRPDNCDNSCHWRSYGTNPTHNMPRIPKVLEGTPTFLVEINVDIGLPPNATMLWPESIEIGGNADELFNLLGGYSLVHSRSYSLDQISIFRRSDESHFC